MTSPGGWFGGFLDDQLNPASAGKSTGTRTSTGQPSWHRTPETDRMPPVSTQTASKNGQAIYDALDMPAEWADDPFTMGVDSQGNLVRMTVARGLEWLRDLSVKNREEYNAWVVKLYDAGYLSESDLRFGAYTSTVGQAFVEAAYDTASINLNDEEGGVVAMGDVLDQLAEGAAAMGGPGGSGRAAPVRVDQQMDEESLKESLRDTSRNLLGRALSDDEEASLISKFRSVESAWNDQAWSAQQGGGTVSSAPDPTAEARESIQSGSLATERASQMLGGYAQVLKNMVGLGGSTAIGGVLNA